MSAEQYTMRDYVQAFRRRSRIFSATFALVVACALAIATSLPDEYRSTAELAVNLEGPNIELLEPVALTAYADQYIKSLEQKVMTGENLRAWLDESNAFAAERETSTRSELLQRMRDSIRVSLVFTPVVDERTGKEVELITGFTTSYFSEDPEVAHVIARNMSTAFLAEDRATRLKRAEVASSFLREQIQMKQKDITDLESEIAEFKEENTGNLPELMVMNMTMLDRAERDLEQLQSQINTLEQDRVFRQAQLAELKNSAGAEPRLAELEEEYLRVVSIYGPNHPDVIRIKRQVEALINTPSAGGDQPVELEELEMQLAEAQQRYTDVHPDVVSLKRKIDALKASSGFGAESRDADYLQLRAQLNAIETDLAAKRKRASELRQRQDELQMRISSTPQVERQYQALNRDLQTAQLAFEDLRKRLSQAQQTESYESGERGARLELVRDANVPEEPSGPQRFSIAVLGIIVGIVFAGSAALVAEMSDSTIRGSKDIQIIMHTHPIAAVPIVQNSVSRSHRRRRLSALTFGGFFLVAAVIVIYSSFAA